MIAVMLSDGEVPPEKERTAAGVPEARCRQNGDATWAGGNEATWQGKLEHSPVGC